MTRLKNVSLEEAWGLLRNKGYNNQFEGDWILLRAEQVLTGRALTVQYLPKRPDFDNLIREKGKAEKRIGNFNSWPIDMLKPGDVYVADSYGKVIDGTLIGDNLGNSIYARSKNGVVFYGSVRDTEGLEQIEGFNAWIKGYDPSYIQEMMLGGINVPIRIGRVTVLPGDAVLAKKGGIVFVPAHLVEYVVQNGEFIALRDQFGHQRLREGKYTPGQIDQQWTDEIKKDFLKWLDENPGAARCAFRSAGPAARQFRRDPVRCKQQFRDPARESGQDRTVRRRRRGRCRRTARRQSAAHQNEP